MDPDVVEVDVVVVWPLDIGENSGVGEMVVELEEDDGDELNEGVDVVE